MKTKRVSVSFGCALVLVAVLSGCGDTGSAGVSPTPQNSVIIPEFTGPYANQFRAAYSNTVSDFARSILEDEVITDQELTEMQDRVKTCLEDRGYTNVEFGEHGSMSLRPPEGLSRGEEDKIEVGCSFNNGEAEVSILYEQMRRNPSLQDESTIMAACMVRRGIVPEGFTAADYDREVAIEGNPLFEGSEFTKCVQDPLDIAG